MENFHNFDRPVEVYPVVIILSIYMFVGLGWLLLPLVKTRKQPKMLVKTSLKQKVNFIN